MVIANIVLIIIMLVIFTVWIYSLVNYDGQENCDKDCDHCPFPQCDESYHK